MKKLAALLCFLSTASIAATGTATSTVKIVPGLTITQTQELDFGSLTCTGEYMGDGRCGEVYIYESRASYVGNISQLGNPTLPSFKVTGEYNAPISFSIGQGSPYVSFILAKTGGQDMSVYLSLKSSGDTLSTNEGGGLGSYTIAFSYARLAVNTNQDPGTYTGSYTVIVNYG